LVNAQHIKAVPGRKTDQKDSEWIADLLQHGLLRASFVPPTSIRELRDLTRYRASLAQEINRIANRTQKVLEDANIKLASVATDTLGASGRAMLEAMIQGEQDSQRLAEMAQGKLRNKIPELQEALQGRVSRHHRFLLRSCWTISTSWNPRRSGSSRRSQSAWALSRVRLRGCAPFPEWTASAGKRKSGKIRKGNLWLRRCLCQGAWAVSTKKNNYLSALYRRLAARRGSKRATIAVAHKLLVITYHILRDGTCYSDLGADYFDRLNPEGLRRRLTKRLERAISENKPLFELWPVN